MDHGNAEVVTGHIKTLRVAAIAAWSLAVLLLYVSSLLPLFDSSPRVVFPERTLRNFLVSPLLRWDAFHFVHIALHGYVYEYEWAFLPGIVTVMQWTSTLSQQLGMSASPDTLSTGDVLSSAALLSCLCSSTTTLYHLTLLHFGSPSLAYLTALLSLLPSSPATLWFSAYTEPFFTYLSYKGELSKPSKERSVDACRYAQLCQVPVVASDSIFHAGGCLPLEWLDAGRFYSMGIARPADPEPQNSSCPFESRCRHC